MLQAMRNDVSALLWVWVLLAELIESMQDVLMWQGKIVDQQIHSVEPVVPGPCFYGSVRLI